MQQLLLASEQELEHAQAGFWVGVVGFGSQIKDKA